MKKQLLLTILFLATVFPLYSQTFVPVPDETVRDAITHATGGIGPNIKDNVLGFYETTLLKVYSLSLWRPPNSLSGISYCKNLQTLSIKGAEFDTTKFPQLDFNEIAGLIHLDSIYISEVDLSYLHDFSFLNKLVNLNFIIFTKCRLSNFAGFEIENELPLTINLADNYLDNDDVADFFKIGKLHSLSLSADITRPRQSFSKERIDTLFVIHPDLVRVSYVEAKKKYVYTKGTVEFVACTDLDTLGADRYFCKYDVRYAQMYFPGGADVYKKADHNWYIKPRNGVELRDTAKQKKLLKYAGIEFLCNGYTLIPHELLNSDITLYGFGTTIGAINSHEQIFTLLDMPYPFNVLIDNYLEKDKKTKILIPTQIQGRIYYLYGVNNPRLSFAINVSNFQFPTFDLNHVSLHYNGEKKELEGKMAVSLASNAFEFDTEIKFSNGALDKLIINVSKSIILGNTGFKITSIGGGIDDFSGPDWKIKAQGNVESMLEIPHFGPVFSGDELAISIAPFSQFVASGKFSILKHEVANGRITYLPSKGCFSIRGGVNFGDILVGNLHSSLSRYHFTGIVSGRLKTPSDLPWSYKYLQNRTIAWVVAKINTNVITMEMDFHGISIAQKLSFNYDAFPYFSYSIGHNLNSLTKILKSTESRTYSVPEGAENLLIVVGNDSYLFDVSAKSPSGIQFNQANTVYLQYPETKQTVMIIRNPEPGNWVIDTDETGEFTYQVLGALPTPVVEFNPAVSNEETDKLLSFTVHNAPDRYKVYIYRDENNLDFDGAEITSWGYYGKGDKTFNIDLNKHFLGFEDTYVYLEVRDLDKKVPPYYIYAPNRYAGTYNNYKPTEVPKLRFDILTKDSIKICWNKPTDKNARFIRIYFKRPADLYNTEINMPLDTNFTYLTNLQNNTPYFVYARFLSSEYGRGENSDTLLINVSGTVHPDNTAPYFITDAGSTWEFFTDSLSTFTIKAGDNEKDTLVFSLPGDTLGITLFDSNVRWKPRPGQTGEYLIPIVVSDSKLTDTLLKRVKVSEKSLTAIMLKVSSYSFVAGNAIAVEVTNRYESGNEVQVQLLNPANGLDSLFTLYRTGQNHFTGAIAVTDSLFHVLNINNGDKVIVNYTTKRKQYAVNLVASYNSTLLGVQKNQNAANKVFISPNPAHAFINIYASNDFVCFLFDAGGKFISRYQGKKVLPVSHLKNGIYYLIVKTHYRIYSFPFVKQ